MCCTLPDKVLLTCSLTVTKLAGTMSNFVPPTHPEARHFVLHENKNEQQNNSEDSKGDDGDGAAINYLEALAGFMGVVDAPKEVDPEAEAAAAAAFLENLWGDEPAEVRATCHTVRSFKIGGSLRGQQPGHDACRLVCHRCL